MKFILGFRVYKIIIIYNITKSLLRIISYFDFGSFNMLSNLLENDTITVF